jgi:hypothetical protein
VVNEALASLSSEFSALYALMGRPSIPPSPFALSPVSVVKITRHASLQTRKKTFRKKGLELEHVL